MTAPAIDPVEVRILDDIQTTIAAIATTHPTVAFYTDVATVRVFDKSPADSAGVALPAVFLVHEGTTHQWAEVTGLCENTVNLAAFCLVKKSPTWKSDVIRLASDVRRALQIDHKRGTQDGEPNAFDTSVDETVIANLIDDNRTAMARLKVTVVFRDDFNDPTKSG